MITEGQVLDIAKDAIYYIIICSAPVLIISLVYQRLWQYLLD